NSKKFKRYAAKGEAYILSLLRSGNNRPTTLTGTVSYPHSIDLRSRIAGSTPEASCAAIQPSKFANAVSTPTPSLICAQPVPHATAVGRARSPLPVAELQCPPQQREPQPEL